MSYRKVYLAIDPGTTGAIALVHGTRAAVWDVPTIVEKTADGGKRTHVDLPALCRLVASLSGAVDEAIVEKVGGRKGDQAWTLGILMFVAGALATACAAAGIPVRYVEPREWKKSLGLKGGKKNKGVGREKAIQLFPYLKKDLARVMDHNRAEALLIGHWATRHAR